MKTLRLSELADAEKVVIARSKIGAALLAFAFPISGVAISLAALMKNGVERLLTHGMFLMLLGPGLFALVYMCRRYWGPALLAFKCRDSVTVDHGVLHVNRCAFAISEKTVIQYDGTQLDVRNGDAVLARFPSFFIRVRPEPHIMRELGQRFRN